MNEKEDKWGWIFQGCLATDGTRLLSKEHFKPILGVGEFLPDLLCILSFNQDEH